MIVCAAIFISLLVLVWEDPSPNMYQDKEQYLLECDTMQSDRNSVTFQRNVLPLSSELKSKPGKQQARTKHQAGVIQLVSCFTYSVTMKVLKNHL
jgi:hypothetical protein